MNIRYEKLTEKYKDAVVNIFNYYIENSNAAYPEKKVNEDFFISLLRKTENYPNFIILSGENILGFCYLSAYNELSTFKECALITYFIDKKHTGKGIGKKVLEKLESEAHKRNIKIILAHISSENKQSILFHTKNGFEECGRFKKIARKNNKYFDIVWMQKRIENNMIKLD